MELHSHEAEQLVIGSVLSRRNGLLEAGKLTSDAFYFDVHKTIWEAILKLEVQDIVTVSNALESKLDFIGGSTYLANCINKAIGNKNISHYADIVRNKAELRSFLEFFTLKAEQIKEGKLTSPAEILQETTNKILNTSSDSDEEHTKAGEICDIYTKLQEDYAEKKAEGIDFLGIPTKFPSLDRATDGFQPEKVWGIAAYTSIGKSSFQVNLIKKLLDQGKRVVLFSLEMSKEELFSKLLAIECEISPIEITKGLLNNEIFAKQMAAKQKYREKNLAIYTECVNYEDILLAMQKEMLREKVDVFFLDYVQNLTSHKAFDQTKLITVAVKELQKITRKLKTTLVLLSQISEETNRAGKSLEVGGKDSGALRAASNVFIYLKREGTEEEIIEKFRTGQDISLKLILNKNRMGRIGSFNLNFKQASGIMYEPL